MVDPPAPPLEPGVQPPSWEPFSFMARPTRHAPVVAAVLADALRSRGVVAAVLDGDLLARPGWALVRVATDTEGRVVTAAGRHMPTPSLPIRDLVGALSHELHLLVIVDYDTDPGPDGRPRPQDRVDRSAGGGDVRTAYAWRGRDRLLAKVLASRSRRPVTVYNLGSWLLTAWDYGTDTAAELLSPPGWAYVAMSRHGAARSVAYVGGKRRGAPRVQLWWTPPAEPVLPDSVQENDAARRVAEWLSEDAEPVEVHDWSDHELLHRLTAATRVSDGDRFLPTVAGLLGVPAAVAELVEGHADAPVGAQPVERVEPMPGPAMVHKYIRDELDDPTGDDVVSGYWRFLHRHPGARLVLGLLEIGAMLVWASGGFLDLANLVEVALIFLFGIDGIVNIIYSIWWIRRNRQDRLRARWTRRRPG